MKSKNILCGLSVAVVLQFGMLAASSQTQFFPYQTNGYWIFDTNFDEWVNLNYTNVPLAPGAYIITAYGAAGGPSWVPGGLGAELKAEFYFPTNTILTLMPGQQGFMGGGGGGGGGGGASYVTLASDLYYPNWGSPLVVAGGGGGGGGASLPTSIPPAFATAALA